MRSFEPDSVAAVTAAVEAAGTDLGFVTLDAKAFGQRDGEIDRLCGDGADQARRRDAGFLWLVRCRILAGGVGAFEPRRARQFQPGFRSVFVDSRGSYVASDRQLVALFGVDNLVVVTTDDAVLVAKREDGDGMRRLVQKLKEVAPAVTEEHLKVHRPWGSYQSVDQGRASRSSASW